ncbi:MAG TPA: M20 family metallopeptidase [Candidatus Saccharimonadales bacterium]|jgi:glutamate carboxypeptidase|nr:M20 family metallopeptidase [Candidatus Saccharimonadales bacterium]
MSSAPANLIVPQVLSFCRQNESQILALLQRLVETESPSDTKAAVDAAGSILVQEFEALGGQITIHRQKNCGDHLQAEFHGAPGQKPVMLLGHFDTVWPAGTLKTMPYRVDRGRVYGPGVFDMKAGITMMVFALRALKELGVKGHRPVTIFLDTDEEVGSESSRPLTEAIAGQCEAVLVLEPSQGPQGFLKTSRKGVGDCTIRVYGRASHAGVDFEKGQSAIVELAHQILAITKFADVPRGITVNPGVVQGGTRTNVVAAEAWVEVDLRVARLADAAELLKRLQSLKPVNPECRLEFSGGINRPPMERTAGTVRLLEAAQTIARSIGVELGESSTGGGSDGNFTSALGIPTLDGLGAVGEGAHAAHESIELERLYERCSVLAGLILEI